MVDFTHWIGATLDETGPAWCPRCLITDPPKLEEYLIAATKDSDDFATLLIDDLDVTAQAVRNVDVGRMVGDAGAGQAGSVGCVDVGGGEWCGHPQQVGARDR